ATMRSISVLPAKLLGTASLKKWDGLATGILVKETRKKAEQKTGDASIKESFYISSFVPDNPCIAEHVARGIWEAPDLPDSFWYLFSIDAFQDISQSKNVNYVQNCKNFKNSYDRISWSLKERTKKTYETIKRDEGRKDHKAKGFFVDLIYEAVCGYVEEGRRKDEEDEEYERKHPLRYF
ncbi:MAG: hypothetical protein LUC43_09055, partial [Burkholderiales bacterium]|nr:hypothetical protein [Burkholderiales bacterium]